MLLTVSLRMVRYANELQLFGSHPGVLLLNLFISMRLKCLYMETSVFYIALCNCYIIAQTSEYCVLVSVNIQDLCIRLV